jgi:alkylated DNA nucleotide flippase Atl1
MDDDLVERVLLVAELIPRGEVAAYGEIGQIVGTGPRHVGMIMSRFGAAVSWWRVTNSYGDLPLHLMEQARLPWLEEGITLKPNGRGCRIAEFGCDQRLLEERYRAALAERGFEPRAGGPAPPEDA